MLKKLLRKCSCHISKAKALFTKRYGYPTVRVTLARGLKIAQVYKQNLQVTGNPTARDKHERITKLENNFF